MKNSKILDEKLYRFDVSNRTITFFQSGFFNLKQTDILIVMNLTASVMLYNFAGSTNGAAYSNSILTLNTVTSAMTNNDKLMVVIQDEETDQYYLKQILSELKNLNEIILNTQNYVNPN